MILIRMPELGTTLARDIPSVYLAGSMIGADWRAEFVEYLRMMFDGVVLNPKARDGETYDLHDTLKWCHDHMTAAVAVAFWFSHESTHPISLLELGLALEDSRVFVGVHPEYVRGSELRAMLAMHRKELRVVSTLDSLADQVLRWGKEMGVV